MGRLTQALTFIAAVGCSEAAAPPAPLYTPTSGEREEDPGTAPGESTSGANETPATPESPATPEAPATPMAPATPSATPGDAAVETPPTAPATPEGPCAFPAACDPTLVAFYRLAGDAQDSSNRGNHGLIMGTPVATQGPDGAAGTAMSFNGETDFIEVESADLDLAPERTVALDIRFHSRTSGGIKRILGKGNAPDSVTSSWSLNLDTTDAIWAFWETPGDGDQGVRSFTIVDPDVWYHVAAVVNTTAGRSEVFIDGVPERDASLTTSSPGPNDDPFYIGARLSNGAIERFIGADMANIRFYHRALSHAEVQQLADL